MDDQNKTEYKVILGYGLVNMDISDSSQNLPTLVQSKSGRKHGQETPNGIPSGAATFPTTVHTDLSSLESSYLGHG